MCPMTADAPRCNSPAVRSSRPANDSPADGGSTMVQPIPEGYPRLIAYIIATPASEAIEFYKRAFGAEERVKMDGPDGMVMHAELGFGDSMLMLADGGPEALSRSPQELG